MVYVIAFRHALGLTYSGIKGYTFLYSYWSMFLHSKEMYAQHHSFWVIHRLLWLCGFGRMKNDMRQVARLTDDTVNVKQT